MLETIQNVVFSKLKRNWIRLFVFNSELLCADKVWATFKVFQTINHSENGQNSHIFSSSVVRMTMRYDPIPHHMSYQSSPNSQISFRDDAVGHLLLDETCIQASAPPDSFLCSSICSSWLPLCWLWHSWPPSAAPCCTATIWLWSTLLLWLVTHTHTHTVPMAVQWFFWVLNWMHYETLKYDVGRALSEKWHTGPLNSTFLSNYSLFGRNIGLIQVFISFCSYCCSKTGSPHRSYVNIQWFWQD